MKGGFYGLKGTHLSLIILALVFTVILFWIWEKNMFLTTLPSPQADQLRLHPDIKAGASLERSSKPQTNGNKGISASPDNRKELPFDVAAPLELEKGPPEIRNSGNNVITTSVEKEGTPINVPKEDARHKRVFDWKKNPKPVEDVNFVAEEPINSTNKSSSLGGKEYKNLTKSAENQVCNYAIGQWVEDNRRPLYSGSSCKQWLSPMWACRSNQRDDFAYEKFRWQPKDCEMNEFTGSNFLTRMQDKTLAFVGDSLGREQFQSLMCMITGGKESPHVIDVGKQYGLVKARGAKRPDGWAYQFPGTNTTILYYWSASLCNLQPLNISNKATDFAMHLDQPPEFLSRFLHTFSVLVLNTGHHWNEYKLKESRWIMHVQGVLNTDKEIAKVDTAKNLTIHSTVKWVNSQLPKYPGLKAFYRTISPRHYLNGDWNTGGTCDNTIPLSQGKGVLEDESLDPVAAAAVKGTGVKLLDITAISKLRDEGHVSRYGVRATPGIQDCLHWCLPGIPDTWNEILFAQL